MEGVSGVSRTITATINGVVQSVKVTENQTLLEMLRETLHLTGAKRGCDEGDCGACTVILNKRPVSSCLVLATEVEGSDILTIEGLAHDGVLHPIQQAFVECGAVQCGFCTPGMVLTAKALLDENPNPTAEEIKFFMSGNLCRCTGYTKIVEAVQMAAQRLK
jgi:carbon-monoxide dehydrogenase small subunit